MVKWLWRVKDFIDKTPDQSFAGAYVENGTREEVENTIRALDRQNLNCELLAEGKVIKPLTLIFNVIISVNVDPNMYQFTTQGQIPNECRGFLKSGLYIRLRDAGQGTQGRGE